MRERALRTTGIVLKRLAIGESDRLVTIFTPSLGKITAMAKGIKKLSSRRASHLELFNHVDLILYQTSTPLITEVSTLQSFGQFRRNIVLASLAFYVGEVVDKLLPDKQPHPQVFELLQSVLSDLNELGCESDKTDKVRGEKIVKNFVSSLIWELGYLPFGQYPKVGLTAMVEEICERRVNSRKFLQES